MIYTISKSISKTTRYDFGYVFYVFHKFYIKLLKKNWLSEEWGYKDEFMWEPLSGSKGNVYFLVII